MVSFFGAKNQLNWRFWLVSGQFPKVSKDKQTPIRCPINQYWLFYTQTFWHLLCKTHRTKHDLLNFAPGCRRKPQKRTCFLHFRRFLAHKTTGLNIQHTGLNWSYLCVYVLLGVGTADWVHWCWVGGGGGGVWGRGSIWLCGGDFVGSTRWSIS